jgi:hypothetical protein
MQQKYGLQGYHTHFVIRGFFRLGWWTIIKDFVIKKKNHFNCFIKIISLENSKAWAIW